MKKSLCFFLVITLICGMSSFGFAANPTFYAMEIDAEEGTIISGDPLLNDGKITNLTLKSDDEIILVFFNENGELLESSELTYKGIYRSKENKEKEFIEEHSTKREDYKYANNILYIDGFRDGEVSGDVSYNGSSVNFTLDDFTYQVLESGENGWNVVSEKNYVLEDNDEKFYARFFYNYNQLQVSKISFVDGNGDPYDESIIKAKYEASANAWSISYTKNLSGKVIVETLDNKTYEMPLSIKFLDIYFGDENGEEIEDEFIYEVGDSEEFYLYNWDGPIEITQGESNVTPIKENGRYKFKITNYTESFKYRIAIDDGKYQLDICSVDDLFHAKEVILDGTGKYEIKEDKIKNIRLFENEVRYYVFYNRDEPINLTGLGSALNISVSQDLAFAGTDLEGFVYEIYLDSSSKIRDSVEYDDYEISIRKEDELNFFNYEKDELRVIKDEIFTYEDGDSKIFYLHVEDRNLDSGDIEIVDGIGYVTIENDTVEVDDEDVNVIKITVNDTVPNEFYLELFISKWNATASITVQKEGTETPIDPSKLPLHGFYRSYTNLSGDTLLGDINDYDGKNIEFEYTPGEIFYYVWKDADSFISGDCKVNAQMDVNVEKFDTGRDILINGVSYDRYAVKIEIPSDAEGTMEGKFTVYYYEEGNLDEWEHINITLTLIDPYDLAPTGETSLDYSGDEYVIGFEGDPYIGKVYENTYEEDDEFDYSKSKMNIKIFKVTEKESNGEEILEYTEVLELYNKIKSIRPYIARFNVETEEYEDISNQVSGDIFVKSIGRNRNKITDEEEDWYVVLEQHNIPFEYYIVADVTMDDGQEHQISVKYNSFKEVILTKDLRDEKKPWSIGDINEYIASGDIQNSDATVIEIILDPDQKYCSGGNYITDTLVLEGKKKIVINGNGAEFHGRVMAFSPVRSGKTPLHKISGVNFVSTLPKTNELNICLDGNGEIEATKCSFSGYYIAAQMYDRNTLGTKSAIRSCAFEGNTYGIRIDGRGKESKFTQSIYENKIRNCSFNNNDYGIYIIEQKEISTVDELIEIYNCEFIGNGEDIVNENEDYKYLVYGCVFLDKNSSSTGYESRMPRTKNITMSYVYKEQFLKFFNGLISMATPTLPTVAYPPYGLNVLTYMNGSGVGIATSGFDGTLNVSSSGDSLNNPLVDVAKINF